MLKFLEQELIPKIQINNTSFSKATFKQQAINTFINVMSVQTEKDSDKLQTFETQELIKKNIQKIKENNNDKIVHAVKEISVVSSFITEYTLINNQEAIKMQLTIKAKNDVEQNTNITNYVLSTYYLEFIKSNENTKSNNTINCPKCGAIVDITGNGRCTYCNSLLINGQTSWVINRIEEYYPGI